jgi:hypothetical protein
MRTVRHFQKLYEGRKKYTLHLYTADVGEGYTHPALSSKAADGIILAL